MAGMLPQNRGNKSAVRVGPIVSRRLKSMGFNISPASRKHRYDGMFVTTAGTFVSVLMDLGLEARNEQVAAEVHARLRGSGWAPRAELSRIQDTDMWRVTFNWIG